MFVDGSFAHGLLTNWTLSIKVVLLSLWDEIGLVFFSHVSSQGGRVNKHFATKVALLWRL